MINNIIQLILTRILIQMLRNNMVNIVSVRSKKISLMSYVRRGIIMVIMEIMAIMAIMRIIIILIQRLLKLSGEEINDLIYFHNVCLLFLLYLLIKNYTLFSI